MRRLLAVAFIVAPGDTVRVAMRFVAADAPRVMCLDKFSPLRESLYYRRLYEALREQRSPSERAALGDAVNLDGGLRLNPDKLRYVYGRGIEDAADLLSPGTVDLIVSSAVLEEVY